MHKGVFQGGTKGSQHRPQTTAERTYLMIGENQSISNNDIFPPAGSENDELGDVVGCQGLNTLVDGIGFGLVTAKSHDGEFLETWVVRETFYV